MTSLGAGADDPASTAAWGDEALHTTHEVSLPRGITLRIASVRRAELVVAVNQGRVREREDITGLRLWDFGRALAAFAVRHANAFRGKRVIEMGAGCGVLSLAVACGCEGVTSVCATDASSMEFLQRNVDAHRGLFVEGADVQVERLLWRTNAAWQEAQEKGAAPGEGPTPVCETGERGTHPRDCASIAGADVIIGTDLLYHLTTCDALFATATRLMRAGGVFLLGGHSRYYGTVQSFGTQRGARAGCQVCESPFFAKPALSTTQETFWPSWAQRRAIWGFARA